MEDPLEKLSNQYRTLFYAIQLKTTDTAQTLRTIGSKLTENQIKTFTNQQVNIFSMTQKLFNQAGATHLFPFLKLMNANLNSLVVILIEIVQRLTQKISMAQKSQAEQNQNRNNKYEGEQATNKDHNFLQVKRNRLGGIQLFNENYTRYLEDHRILDQIRYEKDQRILKKKNQLLSSMIYNQLNHKTDVQGEATPNDDIAKYIVQSRNKGSIYNYVPYQQELQQILAFFQNSQNQANNFLIKKGNSDVQQIGGKFSFADFQRDIQFKNRQFQKKVMDKLLKAMQKLKEKQKLMEQADVQRQQNFKLLYAKKLQGEVKQVQTQLQFNQILKQYQIEVRDLQFKCEALQNHKVQEIKYIQRENQLLNEISFKALHNQKLEAQIKDLQAVIVNLKKMVREQKSKKHILAKDQNSQRNQFGDNRQKSESKKEKQSSSGSQFAIGVEEYLSLNSNTILRKTSHKSFNWNRKPSNDGTSMMSFNQSQKQTNEREQNSRAHGRKFVKYNIQSFRSNQQDLQYQKSKGPSFKFNRQIKSKQSAIQTEMKEQLHQQQLNPTQKIITSAEEQQQDLINQRIQTSKSSRLRLQSDPLHTNLTSLSNIQKEEQKTKQKANTTKKNNSNTKAVTKQNKETNKQRKEKSKEVKEVKEVKEAKQVKMVKEAKELKELKENVEIIIKKPPQQKQKKENTKKTTPKSNIKQISKFDELMLTKKKNTSKKNDKQMASSELKPRSQAQHAQSKDQNLYKMFEVVQEDGQEEKQSIRNTKRSSLVDLIPSPRKRLDYESLQKFTKEIRKMKTEKNYFCQQLYSFTIKPYKQHQKLLTQPNYTKDMTTISSSPEKHSKFDAFKKFRNSTETSQILMMGNQTSLNNVMQFFDKIQKSNKISSDRNTLLKVKNWKKKIQNICQNNLMSSADVQNIANLLQLSADKLNSVYQNKINSGIVSVDFAKQKSLVDLQQEQINSSNQTKPNHSNLRHNSLSDPFNHKVNKTIQNQVKLQELITFQALHDDFSAKFQKIHKHCKQGGICSHITKYFEIIMKHFEQTRQKQKSLLSLHVQNIGSTNTVENEKQGKKFLTTQQSTLIQSRQSTYMKLSEFQNRYQGKSLQKMKKSKLSLLPCINQPRSSLYYPCP